MQTITIKSKKKVEIDMLMTIAYQAMYLLMGFLLAYLFPFLLMVFAATRRTGRVIINERLDKIIGDWYNGFQEGSHHIYCIAFGLLFSLVFMYISLNKKHLTQLTFDGTQLLLYTKNKLGKVEEAFINKDRLRLQVDTFKKVPVAFKFYNLHDKVATIEIDDTYWFKKDLPAFKELFAHLDGVTIEYDERFSD